MTTTAESRQQNRKEDSMTTPHESYGPWTEPYDEAKDHLSKPLVKRLQYDGWAHFPPGDSVMHPDDEGDVLMSGGRRERHRSGTTVRIWIDPDADREDVARLLRKLTHWWASRPPTTDPTDT